MIISNDKDMDKYVRLNSLVSKAQKAIIKKLAKERMTTEAAIVRDVIYKVYKIK